MLEVPNKLIQEAKVIIRFYLFLRYDCGLREADELSAKELRELVKCLKRPRRNTN